MKKTPKSKKTAKNKKLKPEAKAVSADLLPEYPLRLAELEAELHAHEKRATATADKSAPAITHRSLTQISGNDAIRFHFQDQAFAIGHTEITFPGSEQARGVRTIRLHDQSDAVVLEVTAEFENHSYGTNLRLHRQKSYIPGPWESAFQALTTALREFRANRWEALRKMRARNMSSGTRS